MTTDLPAADRQVRTGGPGRRWSTRRVAGVTAGGFLVVASFQVALALGAPFGAAALGGLHAGRLPADLRLASAAAAAFWLLATVHVLSRGGLVRHLPRAGAARLTWVMVGVTVAAALLNAASASPWERYGWAPYSLVLAILCLVLARRGRTDGSDDGR